jgi:hypothetical protein
MKLSGNVPPRSEAWHHLPPPKEKVDRFHPLRKCIPLMASMPSKLISLEAGIACMADLFSKKIFVGLVLQPAKLQNNLGQ